MQNAQNKLEELRREYSYKMKAATACRELKAEGAKSIKKVRIESFGFFMVVNPRIPPTAELILVLKSLKL